jgi:flagellar L-ring protein precursor FlgH
MSRFMFLLAIAVLHFAPALANAQSLWDRRTQNAYLFNDTRARRVGDILTIVVNESTEFTGQDKKELNKQTNTSAQMTANGSATMGQLAQRTFTGEADGGFNSTRNFQGTANNTIDRKFLDRMTVVVVEVLPNGNLVIEGRRQSTISKECRTLVVTGVVRPLDIGAYNMVMSHAIADFAVIYETHGPESSFTNHGWLGAWVNKVWPF